MSLAAKSSRMFHKVTGGHLRGVKTLSLAFIRLDLLEDLAYPLAFLLSELGIFVPVLSYFFIGELVGGSAEVGGDYFTFSAIGISVSVVLQASLSGFGRALQRAQDRGQLEFILAEPIPWTYLPVAMNSWRTIVGFANGVLILFMAGLLGADFVLGGLPQFFLLLILGIGASMAVGILAASMLIVAKRSQPVLTLYGLASSLLGGALFSVDQLPAWLKIFSFAIPHTYVINSARTVLMDDPGTFVIPFATAAWLLLAFNVVVLTFGIWLFRRALQFARDEGILGGY